MTLVQYIIFSDSESCYTAAWFVSACCFSLFSCFLSPWPEEEGAVVAEGAQSKWKEQEAALAGTETIGESGRIFVRNLSYSATEEDLEQLFAKFGPLTEAR